MRRYVILHDYKEESGQKVSELNIPVQKPKDWEFMEQSGAVLKNIPDTWKGYPHDCKGMRDIIAMEYGEFVNAVDHEDMSHELVHLASACLYLWRYLNDAE